MAKHPHPETSPEIAAQPIVADAPPSREATIVDLWFRETFHNRALDNNELNRLTAAKERLVALLAGR